MQPLFEFELQQKNQKLFNKLIPFLLAIIAILFSIFIKQNVLTFQGALAIYILFLGYSLGLLYKTLLKKPSFKYLSIFTISSLGFLIAYFFGIFIGITVLLFLSFIYWFTQQKSQFLFYQDKISIQHKLYKRIFLWQQLNNVVLKDGILTLDFKNDKLIQEEGNLKGNLEEFNTFLSEKFNT